LGFDERRQFGHNELCHRIDIALPLQQCGKTCEVGFKPILFGTFERGVAQVLNHLVDILREHADFTARFDIDRARKVAFGYGSGDIGDGPNLAAPGTAAWPPRRPSKPTSRATVVT